MYINRSDNTFVLEEKDGFTYRELAIFFFYSAAYNAGFIKRRLNIGSIFREGMKAMEDFMEEKDKEPISHQLSSYGKAFFVNLADDIENFEHEDGVLEFSNMMIELKNNHRKNKTKRKKQKSRKKNHFCLQKFCDVAENQGFTEDEIQTFIGILVPFPIPRVKDKFFLPSEDRLKSLGELYCAMQFPELLH